MKTFTKCLTLACLLLSISPSPKGAAVVYMENYTANVPIFLMWSPDSKAPGLYYEVLAGPVGMVLTPLAPNGATNSVLTSEQTDSEPGYFDGGFGVIPDIPDNGSADFIVRAWVGLPGSTYETAQVKGESARWTQTVGVWDPEALPPFPPQATALEIPGPVVYPDADYYSVAADTNGEGTIVWEPTPFFSGFRKGSTVTLTAIPNPGWQFDQWVGADAGTNNPIQLTIDRDKTLRADFKKIWTLTVEATAGGLVRLDPLQPFYWDGQVVQVEAIPENGYYFLEWSGDLVSDSTLAFLTIHQDLKIHASFANAPKPPIILTQPIPLTTVTAGREATFSIAAKGTQLSYLWYRNDAPLPEATNDTLRIANIPIADNGSTYFCVVSNPGGQVKSEIAFLKVVLRPPVITRQPQSQTVSNGTRVTLTVQATGESLSYAWYRNDSKLPGQTNATYVIANANQASIGTYYCIVSNAAGRVTSYYAYIDVITPLPPQGVSIYPLSVTVDFGGWASFWASAYDSRNNRLYYSWYKDGLVLPGSTNTTLALTNLRTADGGKYWFVVSNIVGAVTSSVARLTVRLPPLPRIFEQPRSCVVHIGQSTVFSVEAYGWPSLAYQWQFNGADVIDATNAILRLDHVQPSQAGVYQVVVKNDTGPVTSAPATNTVLLSPKIVTPLRSHISSEGTEVWFWVEAVGQPPLAYQWRFNGVNLSGATQSDFRLPEVTLGDTGGYSVVVSNEAGSDTSEATLIVKSEPQIMGLRLADDSVILTIKTKPRLTHAVEASPDLWLWGRIGNFTSDSDWVQTSVPMFPGQPKTFYRVRITSN